MAYQTIYYKILFIQYIIFDFISNKSIKVIDLTTEDGQLEYIRIFGIKKFNRLLKFFNIKKMVIQIDNKAISLKSLIMTLSKNLNERSRRLVAAFYVLIMNKRENTSLPNMFNLDMKTIRKGKKELNNGSILNKNRIRHNGGGRKPLSKLYNNFCSILESLADDHIAGDPMSNKRWVRKDLRYFKEQMKLLGMCVSTPSIKKYFRDLKISLKVNKKSISSQQHVDRDLQFQQITWFKNAFIKSGNPVISVDAKKKELIGQFKNAGKVWKKDAIRVNDHDFKSLSKGIAIPYGIYDIKQNKGYLFSGTSHDTSQFAVEMIVRWWEEVGQFEFKNKKNLLILCDSEGSNSYRRYGWKIELQNLLASALGLKVTVYHYPPGTSKWNPIEHKLFSFISINWAGEPLNSYKKLISFMNSTTTKTGLRVKGHLVNKEYGTKKKYSDDQKRQLNIIHAMKLPNWNYTIYP